MNVLRVASRDMHLNVRNMTTWFLTVISNYNSHFSPLQAALHLGQRIFTSKIVSKQTVPWGRIAVIKPGNCYEPCEKDTGLMPWMLQIPMLLFMPLQPLFKGYYSKYIEVQCNYKQSNKSKTGRIPSVIWTYHGCWNVRAGKRLIKGLDF